MQLQSTLRLYAVIGLPIALIFTLIVGLPVWSAREHRHRTRAVDAALAGASVGAIYELVLIILSVIYGLKTANDPDSYFSTWSFGYQIVEDGLRTPLGWLVQMVDTAWTVVTGALAGFVAHRVAMLYDRVRQGRHL